MTANQTGATMSYSPLEIRAREIQAGMYCSWDYALQEARREQTSGTPFTGHRDNGCHCPAHAKR